MTRRKAVAVVVTYNPDMGDLAALLRQLAGEKVPVVVVDNGSSFSAETIVAESGAQWLALNENMGIGAAQNRGIKKARLMGAGAIVLFDQDSLPDFGMIDRLAEDVEMLEAAGTAVAAVGPTYRDDGLDADRPGSDGNDAPIEVDHVIASGSYIPLQALDRAGDMRESLFIDYVDIEWALRAAQAGLRSFQSRRATMVHRFGEPATILGRRVSMRPPMRQYYLFRNSIWLWRQRWVPLNWKLRRGGRLLLRMAFNIVFATPHAAQLRMIGRGIRDGMAGRLGRGHD